MEDFQAALEAFRAQYADTRLNVCELELDPAAACAVRGRLLDAEMFDALRLHLAAWQPDLSGVTVLRQPYNRTLRVGVNLTSLHAGPSWLSEQLSQLLFGWPLEVLEERGRWAFVRQMDGYLGWAYLPYLTDADLPEPTHLVLAPVAVLHQEPAEDSPLVGRALGGSALRLLSTRGAWAQVQAEYCGWLLLQQLRALDALPKGSAAQRKQLVADAMALTGVPYLWGGCTAHGIDCSGLAQLAHRWVGMLIPRDADMQYDAGRKVEFPYQPGDLLFFGEVGDRRSITHVAISLGGWDILHSSRSRNGVYCDNVQAVAHLKESFVGAATFFD